MKYLSEGLQSIGGGGHKRFMSAMTTNRIAGMVTGVVSTVIVQSSSIIAVMAVGFVSSGLMDLTQAINVIIGSNIGTTATAWLIAYAPNVQQMGLTAVTLGALLYFGFRREGIHNCGLALLGLGLVFIGLSCMNEAIAPLKKSEAALKLFATIDAATLGGLLHCFAVSLVFTAIVQSSAATTAIVMTLANQGVITFEAVAATVFGMNIGTTITAWLAAASGSTEARRTAMAHTLFNVAGTVILMPLFIPVVLPAVKAFFPDRATAPAAPMAAVHTGFNIVTTLCFLPFTAPFAAVVGAFQRRVLTAFLAGKHLRTSVLAELSAESKDLRHAIRTAREGQLRRIGGAGSSPLIALATLDIFNAFDRVRSCLINIAETLAGGKRVQ